MMLLIPSDVLRPRRPDEHFAAEAQAAQDAGFQVGLVDHDALAAADPGRAVARLPSGTRAVYRGWMLTSTAYAGFAAALTDRAVTLRTGPEDYRRGHELPGWCQALEQFTPATTWTDGDAREAFDAERQALGPGPVVLRDYTKSMKHYWHEAAFVPDLADGPAAWAVAERLRELRGDEFTGGFVLRRFEKFVGAEARTWWVHGVCRVITAHPDTPDRLPPNLDVSFLQPAIAGLGLPFVTVDLAQRADGQWRVIELGDGQVSDRPSSTTAQALIEVALNAD